MQYIQGKGTPSRFNIGIIAGIYPRLADCYGSRKNGLHLAFQNAGYGHLVTRSNLFITKFIRNLVLVLLILFISACTSNSKLDVQNKFKVEFGNIVEVGEFYEIRPYKGPFLIKEGIPSKKFGVRVENLERLSYNLGFYIDKFNENTDSYSEFTNGGYWEIKPPVNPDYEAFIWEDEKPYSVGRYRFRVVVDAITIRVFTFSITEI